MTKRTFWTYERDVELYDGEFKTPDLAYKHAEEAFAERCGDQNPKNNEQFSEDIYLIQLGYDDESGDCIMLRRIESMVSYTHYHGDLKEHGTW